MRTEKIHFGIVAQLTSNTQFDLLLEGYLDTDSVDLKLHYNKHSISLEVAQEVCTVLAWAIQYLISTEISLQAETLSETFQDEQKDVEQGKPKSLSDDFFEFIFGASKSSTTEFWKAQLSGTQITNSLASRISISSSTVDDVNLILGDIERNCDFSPEIVISAAWSILLAQLGESDEVRFGVNMARRQELVPGSKSVIGGNLSMIPIRAVLDFSSRVRHFLEYIQNQAKDIAYCVTCRTWAALVTPNQF